MIRSFHEIYIYNSKIFQKDCFMRTSELWVWNFISRHTDDLSSAIHHTNDHSVCLTRLSGMFTEYKRQWKINLHDANEARTPLPCWSPRNAICVFAGPISGARIGRSRRAKYLPGVQRARKKRRGKVTRTGIISCGFLRSLRDFHLDAVRYASPFIVSRDADPWISLSREREAEAETMFCETSISLRYPVDRGWKYLYVDEYGKQRDKILGCQNECDTRTNVSANTNIPDIYRTDNFSHGLYGDISKRRTI